MTGRFTSTRIDPRRLSHPPHQIGRQSYGDRQRIHGAVPPMADQAEPSWKAISLAALIFLLTGLFWVASPTF